MKKFKVYKQAIDLLEHKEIDISELDENLYYDLEGTYRKATYIKENIKIDEFDLDKLSTKADVVIIDGDLHVKNGIINLNGDDGVALIVTGDVKADFIIAGGSEIYLNGNTVIDTLVYGFYNHGILGIANVKTQVVLKDDHSMDINGAYGKRYDIFDATYKFAEALDGDYDFLEKEPDRDGFWYSVDSDLLIEFLMDKKNRKALAKKIGTPISRELTPKELILKDGLNLKKVKDPSDELILLAIGQNPHAIQFVENPNEEMQLLAVQGDGMTLEFLKNPTLEIQKMAIEQNGCALKFIDNPSKDTQLLALKSNGEALEFIQNPTQEMQLLALNTSGGAIKFIENQTDEMKIMAIKDNPDMIEHIKNPTQEIFELAIDTDPYSIIFMDYPTEEIILRAIMADIKVAPYINTLKPETLKLAKKKLAEMSGKTDQKD